jgi:hypothetical protein
MNPDLEAMQRQLLQTLAVGSQPVEESQYVHVSEAATRTPSVVGVRLAEEKPFTGWKIVATNESPDIAKFGYWTVREIQAEHPAWLVALVLPTGWAFRFTGDTLIDCVSQAGVRHVVKMSVPSP